MKESWDKNVTDINKQQLKRNSRIIYFLKINKIKFPVAGMYYYTVKGAFQIHWRVVTVQPNKSVSLGTYWSYFWKQMQNCQPQLFSVNIFLLQKCRMVDFGLLGKVCLGWLSKLAKNCHDSSYCMLLSWGPTVQEIKDALPITLRDTFLTCT